jgi:putative acetyltransferase
MASEIGAVRADELDEVRQLYRDYRAYIESLYPFRPFEDAEILALPGRYQLIVYRCEGRVAGCVAWHHWSDGIAEMKRLYVGPAARGQGAGRQLTEYVIDEVRRLDYRTLRLDTLEAMTPAIALYRSLGFQEIENYHGRPLPWALFFELPLR